MRPQLRAFWAVVTEFCSRIPAHTMNRIRERWGTHVFAEVGHRSTLPPSSGSGFPRTPRKAATPAPALPVLRQQQRPSSGQMLGDRLCFNTANCAKRFGNEQGDKARRGNKCGEGRTSRVYTKYYRSLEPRIFCTYRYIYIHDIQNGRFFIS